MIDVTITNSTLAYHASIIGDVEATYSADDLEIVDSFSLHIPTERGVLLFNVLQYTFNGQTFLDAEDAVEYLQSL